MRLLDLVPLAGLLALGVALALAAAHEPPPLVIARLGEAPDPDPLPPTELDLAQGVLSGRVEDAAGRAVPEALIAAESGARLVFTHSASDGSFELRGVPSEAFEVLLVAPGFAPERLPQQGPAAAVRLVLGQPYAPPPRLRDHEESELRGRVRLPGDEAQRSAFELWLEPEAPGTEPSTHSTRTPRRAAVAADGNFVVPRLAHGTYRAHLLPDWARGGSWPDLLESDGAGALLVHPAPAAPELELAQGSLSLTVHGPAMRGALVLVSRIGREGRLEPWPALRSDELGRVELGRLPAGEYRVLVQAGSARAELDFVLRPSEALDLGLVQLEEARQ